MISEDGEQLGVVSIEVALEKASEAGLDLIEVGPNSKPPVCKILDYGKYSNQTIYECADDWCSKQVTTNGIVSYFKAYYAKNC